MKPNGNTYKVTTLKTSAAHTAAITALVDATAGMILLTTPTDINTQHIQKLTAIPGNTTLSMGGGGCKRFQPHCWLGVFLVRPLASFHFTLPV